MTKANIKTNIVLSLLFSIFLVILFQTLYLTHKDITMEIEVKHNKVINFQIFYIKEIGKSFNEKDSFKYLNESTNNGFQTLKFNLNDVENLINLRVDLGEYPGEVWIKSIKILGQKNIAIFSDKLINYPMNQINEKQLETGNLKIYSNKVDPFIVFEGNGIQNMKKEIINFPILIVLYIMNVIIVYFLLSFLDNKSKNRG